LLLRVRRSRQGTRSTCAKFERPRVTNEPDALPMRVGVLVVRLPAVTAEPGAAGHQPVRQAMTNSMTPPPPPPSDSRDGHPRPMTVAD
jgi:hypothetical protein